MRKQTRLVAVLSAAALLAIGASMTSFAATGWAEEDGSWVYYDKEGDRVTDTWKKSGSNWFYLDDNGEMAVETLITDSSNNDNLYYVDANGAMVANQWVEAENEDYDGDDTYSSQTCYYYFQANGKAYKDRNVVDVASFKLINGKKYIFDEDGKMLFGWIDANGDPVTDDEPWKEGLYFCGDANDGAMRSGWAMIDCQDDLGESAPEDMRDDGDYQYYFYFLASGKKYEAADGGDNVTKTINGKKYTFDENGVMQSTWYQVATPAVVGGATASNATTYHYYNSPEEGWMNRKGWFKEVPSENVNSSAYNDDSAKWYYADATGDLITGQFKTLAGKKYAFNKNGEMLSGLQALKINTRDEILTSAGIDTDKKIDALVKREIYTDADGNSTNFTTSDWVVYYFGTGDDGALKSGNQNVVVDGDVYSYLLNKSGVNKGQGRDSNTEGLIDKKYIAVRGMKIKADTDVKYQAVDLDGTTYEVSDLYGVDTSSMFLVNTSGTIVKSKGNGVKDGDGYYFTSDSDGKITGVYRDKENGALIGKVDA